MQNFVLKLVRVTFFIILLLASAVFICAVYLHHKLQVENQNISNLARNITPPTSAFIFNYSKSLDSQIEAFSKNLGLWENPKKVAKPKLGANGFMVFDIDPAQANDIFLDFDDILSLFLDENISLANREDKNSQPSTYSTPLAHLLEEAWNGKTFLIGSAIQFHPSFVDYLSILTKSFSDKFFSQNKNFYDDLIAQNIPTSLQNFLNKHSLEVEVKSSKYDNDGSFLKSTVTLSISNAREFLDSLCTEEMNPEDFCGRFLFDRFEFRKNISSLFFLFQNKFELKLNVYWKIQGGTLVFSNRQNFVTDLLDQSRSQNNVLTDVSASGDDFLLPEREDSKYARVSVVFDMIRIQNKILDFFERMKNQSRLANNLFSSPTEENSFEKIQQTVNTLTGYSEKSSFTLNTNGEKLFSEARLYSPSEDLFTQDEKSISPEILNSMRMLLTKTISFGNYVLPRGLFPIPKPVVTKNGKWTIIRSELLLRSIAPYLKRVGPQIEPDYAAEKL